MELFALDTTESLSNGEYICKLVVNIAAIGHKEGIKLKKNKEVNKILRFYQGLKPVVILIASLMIIGSVSTSIERPASEKGFSHKTIKCGCESCNSSEGSPSVIEYEYVDVNTTEVMEKIEKGEPVEIPFYNITFNLSLQKVDIYAECAVWIWTDENNETQNMTAESHSYGGIANGYDNSTANLTIDTNFLDGFVVVENSTNKSLVRWYIIEPNYPDENGNIIEENKSYRTYVLDVLNPNEVYGGKSSGGDKEHEETVGESSKGQTNMIIHRIFGYGDGYLYFWKWFYGSIVGLTESAILALCFLYIESEILKVNQVYNKVWPYGIRFIIEGIYIETRFPDPLLTPTDSSDLLMEFNHIMVTDYSPYYDYHVAHLFTGRDLDGDVVGTAYQPGAYSLSQQCKAKGTKYDASGYARTCVESHEIGHNYDGDHDLAKKIKGKYTIMWPSYEGKSKMVLIFSMFNQLRIYVEAQRKTME